MQSYVFVAPVPSYVFLAPPCKVTFFWRPLAKLRCFTFRSWVLFCAVVAGPGFYSVSSWGVLGSILWHRGGSWVLFCAVVAGPGFYSAPSWGMFPPRVFRRILRFSVEFLWLSFEFLGFSSNFKVFRRILTFSVEFQGFPPCPPSAPGPVLCSSGGQRSGDQVGEPKGRGMGRGM